MCIGTNLLTLQENKEKLNLELFSRAHAEFPEFRKYQTSDFFYANQLRNSRTFYLKGKERYEPGFVPFADMLNHEKQDKVNIKWQWISDE